jgi:ABC-type glycerol-3-phosphate transport system substrate-binding protein
MFGTPGFSRRRQLLAPALVCGGAALGAALAACGGAPVPEEDAGGAAKAPDQIVWSTFRGARDSGKWRLLQIDRFQARFPKTRVELQVLTQDYPKQYALAAAGTLGDVYAWDPSHWVFYQAVGRKLIRPVDDFIRRDKLKLEQFFLPFIEYQKWDGKTWGLPSWGWTGFDGWVVNEKLATEAGLAVPDYQSPLWTMDAVYDYGARLGHYMARKGEGAYGVQFGGANPTAAVILARAFSGELLTTDGKKAAVREAPAARGFKWLYDLATKERAVQLPEQPGGDFNQDQVGMVQWGSLSAKNSALEVEQKQLGAKPVALLWPKRADGKRPNQLRGGTWNVGVESAGAKSPDAAWELLKLITDHDGALALNTIGGEGALVRPDIMDDAWFQVPVFRPYIENLSNGMNHIVPANFLGVEYEDTFGTAWLPMYKGELGFDEGLRQLSDAIDAVLQKPAS